MSCVSHSFDKGELYTTQSQAIIKLIQKKVKDKKLISSNINVLIKTVLNLLIFFFLRKDFTRTKKHQKASKSTKSTTHTKKHKNTTNQKHKNANKQTKIKNALKKHLSGKK